MSEEITLQWAIDHIAPWTECGDKGLTIVMLGLIGETGELLEEIDDLSLHSLVLDKLQEKRDSTCKEACDVLVYLVLYAKMTGIEWPKDVTHVPLDKIIRPDFNCISLTICERKLVRLLASLCELEKKALRKSADLEKTRGKRNTLVLEILTWILVTTLVLSMPIESELKRVVEENEERNRTGHYDLLEEKL